MGVWVDYQCKECGNIDEWFRGKEVKCEECGAEMEQIFSPKKNGQRAIINDYKTPKIPGVNSELK